MDKLNEINEFMKYFPKMDVEDAILNKTSTIKNKNNKFSKGDGKVSLNEINKKVHEKISKFNVNSRKNNKKQRIRGKNNRPKESTHTVDDKSKDTVGEGKIKER